MNIYNRSFRTFYLISAGISAVALIVLYSTSNASETYIHIAKTILLMFMFLALPLQAQNKSEIESVEDIKNDTFYKTICILFATLISSSFVMHTNFELKIDTILDLFILALSYFYITFEIRKYLAKRNISNKEL